jgi:exopolysaccharide biosynthesis polyprenyl glycosylphosphotransferase
MIRILREILPSNVLLLAFTEAVIVLACFLLAAFLLLPVDPVVYLLYDGGLARILIAVASIIVALYFHDLYTQITVRSRILLLQQILQVIGISFLFQALLFYANSELILPRWMMMLGGGMTLVAVTGWRLFYSSVVLQALGAERILFVGCNALVEQIVRHIAANPNLGLSAVGYLDVQPNPGVEGLFPYLGRVDRLRELAEEQRPDRIIVGLTERRGQIPLADLLDLRFSGIRIQEAAAAYEEVSKTISLKELRPSQLIYMGGLGPRPGMVALQVAYSKLIALVGLVVTSPLMLLIAAAVKLTSPGPVFYRQTRVGWRGRNFTLYKFRSMRADAEAATGAVWATKDDPRVTPVGRWLRRLRLDELPQFFNVLRGEMSLVGPRPERPEFVASLAQQIPYYRQRLAVRPGITGWAQINHEYGDSVEDAARKLEYDLYYIKNLSPALDAYIILQTLKTVLLQRGAQ